jgi:predicted nucleic acid-binding protein
MKYLIDASALYSVFESGNLPLVSDISVLTLTKYEVGNVVWKRNRRKEIKDFEFLTKALKEFFASVNVMEIEFDDAESIAVKRDISFYDAAYISAAESNNLLLVTEDKEILKKSENAISTEDAMKRKAW